MTMSISNSLALDFNILHSIISSFMFIKYSFRHKFNILLLCNGELAAPKMGISNCSSNINQAFLSHWVLITLIIFNYQFFSCKKTHVIQ